MRTLTLLFAAAFFAQAPPVPPVENASQLYFVAFLRPVPGRRTLAPTEANRIQSAHMANIHKMADDGVLAAAGPMDDHTVTISGIFIFKVASLAEAQHIAQQDPTVIEHRNSIDVHAWRGPAGIGEEYFRFAKAHPNEQAHMAGHVFCIFLKGAGGTAAGSSKNHLNKGHLKWVARMRAQRQLAAAGPVEGDPQMAVIAIFKSDSLDDANKLIAEDPAVKSGELHTEMHLWWSADRVLPW
jgi:uncharacterized protein YciI